MRCVVPGHLQRHPHKLKMRGRATPALSSASGSCQHILTSPGGGQLGLTSSGAPGPLSSYSCYLSLHQTHTHTKTNIHIWTQISCAHKSCHMGPQTMSVLYSHQAQSQSHPSRNKSETASAAVLYGRCSAKVSTKFSLCVSINCQATVKASLNMKLLLKQQQEQIP